MAEHSSHQDSYTPVEIARKVEQYGITKGNLPFGKVALLAIMAGAFVAMGCIFYITVTADSKLTYGMTMLIGGLCFNLGLMLCVIAGAELFTGNSLLSLAWAQKKITLGQVLRNWALVWTFNFVGSLIMVALLYYSQAWAGGGNAVGARALYVGASKASLAPGIVFLRGMIANVMVCLASWMAYSGRTVTDKFMGMFLPITAFVAGGYEHSIANMFFIPFAMLVKGNAAVAAMPGVPVEKLHYLTGGYFAQNLFFSTLGNLVGGALLVGLVYWTIYLRSDSGASSAKSKAAA
ncbi:MAG TPA: formate/nitrite transporter family protein [Symbiobacteriaceae bacterium]|nr:formate/nitrite transporter family protein [Symbiobacteriaceae bacterium]